MEKPFQWITLLPERVEGDEARLYEAMLGALRDFRVEYEKGHETGTWLYEHVLDSWPAFITWVCWDPENKRIDGVFSVGRIKPHPGDLGEAPFEAQLAPTSEIKNVRRHADAWLSEDELIEVAVSTAVEDWRAVGAVQATVVLDPDGAKLHQEHKFWNECADKRRIWARFQIGKDGPRPEGRRS